MDVIAENINIILGLRKRRKSDLTDDVYEMIEMVVDTCGFNVMNLQEEYIRNLNYIFPYIEKMYTVSEDMEWPYHAKGIMDGKFPIEKLPVHLRDLTQKLYYNKRT